MIEAKVQLDITPKELAEIFWHMSNREQAAFFSELHKVIKESHPGDEYGYGQWLYLRDGIRDLPADERLGATNTIRSIAADCFIHLIGDRWDWERFGFDVPALTTPPTEE